MPGFYTVMAARNAGNKPNPHGGELTKWYVTLANDKGQEMSRIYWQRKAGSEVSVGDKVYGTVTQGDYGPRFKMEPRPDGSTPPSSIPSAGPQAGGDAGVPPNPAQQGHVSKAADDGREPSFQDERQRRIERQHSQEMAIRLFAAAEPIADGRTAKTHLPVIKALTDWFANDLNSPHSPPSTGHSPDGNGEGVAVHSVEKGEGAAPSSESLEQEVDRQVASGGLVEVRDRGETF
jgi:hypothetical protein